MMKMRYSYYVRAHFFIYLCYLFVVLDLICSDNTGDVLYMNVPTFRGTMCQVNHTAFTVNEMFSKVNCAIKCAWHPGCHSIFYSSGTRLCVGCGRRYNTVADAVEIKLDSSHSRGICDVSLVSGLYGIPDTKITVSSYFVKPEDHELNGPKYSRLNNVWTTVPGSGSWAAATINRDEYIQAEFYNIKLLTGIVTRGRPDNPHAHQYVTEYKVHYSFNCSKFSPVVTPANTIQVFPGNFDRDTVVTNVLTEPLYARCVRIYPTGHVGWVSMRFGLLGCI